MKIYNTLSKRKEDFSYLRARVNFNSCFADSSLGYPSCQKIMLFQVQLMSQTIVQHDLKTGIEKNLHGRVNRRIPLPYNCNFFLYFIYKSH